MKLRSINSPFEWRKIKKLYKTAFPKYERKPLRLIQRMYRKNKADVWIIEADKEFSGFAITMNAMDMVLLDYFAISERKRGLGLGAEALGKLQEYYKGKRFFLEIESIYVEADNLQERIRRKQFYCNNGMEEMHVMAEVFGTEMELLGYQCKVSFEEYYSVYFKSYGEWATKNLREKTVHKSGEGI